MNRTVKNNDAKINLNTLIPLKQINRLYTSKNKNHLIQLKVVFEDNLAFKKRFTFSTFDIPLTITTGHGL